MKQEKLAFELEVEKLELEYNKLIDELMEFYESD